MKYKQYKRSLNKYPSEALCCVRWCTTQRCELAESLPCTQCFPLQPETKDRAELMLNEAQKSHSSVFKSTKTSAYICREKSRANKVNEYVGSFRIVSSYTCLAAFILWLWWKKHFLTAFSWHVRYDKVSFAIKLKNKTHNRQKNNKKVEFSAYHKHSSLHSIIITTILFNKPS